MRAGVASGWAKGQNNLGLRWECAPCGESGRQQKRQLYHWGRGYMLDSVTG